ncbi:phenylalanine--tRNA ligase subunit alpha [Acidiluteibacter ferrifornacis]|uniref:Phenylalanine--tRNA ligase alpha subunit n=1 Tax=Acidiluteibacter ferrifornacis TaxID=2692424 RepID=A0A6N9NI84_9FLAO|nr:phenylalanine--tRNA ligase subunit alpha [Acidiluteibacter ferrifornacis]NBG64917.1 phenylalanine--tRNA ligase subunit alpha [Acidiluteibacter ferrifornacis]
MLNKVKELLAEVEAFNSNVAKDVEEFRIRILGSKGQVKALFDDFKNVPNDQKKEFGKALNELKQFAQNKLEELKSNQKKEVKSKSESIDMTAPALEKDLGARHPLSLIRSEIIEIFKRIGFNVSEGPEIEDDWHNFSALNFPEEHPARDMQDTFFVEKNPDIALRTHTSSVQVRVMENSKPPIRTISPGRVYRNEAISARAHCFFHQVEGLYIDKNVSFADLKQTLLYFAKEMFGEDTEIRLRPSYFPFTEPSAEMDVSCSICKSKGCNVCKYTGFLEILGCGMVDPNVLENCGIDSKVYSGFAFGMGVERIAQLKFNVNDLRLYSENDARFLSQFK